MNFNELEKTWDRQTVTAENALIAASLSKRLNSDIRHERRRVLGGIVVVAFAVLVGWIVTIGFHFAGIAPINRMTVISLSIGTIIDAAFFILAIRSARRIQSELKASTGTLANSASASLRTIESRMDDTRLAAYGLPLVVVANAALCLVKYSTGDLPGFSALIGAIAVGIFLGAILAAMWWRYRTHLLPRRTELQELLASLHELPAR